MSRHSCLLFPLRWPLLWLLSAIGAQAWAQSAPGSIPASIYEATVPLATNTERGRMEAFTEAMRQVLVRATGREGAPDEPGLAPLVKEAGRYVQLYRPASDGMLFVGFDARRIEGLIGAADPSQMRSMTISVTGIASVGIYAEVSAALEALVQIRRLEVMELKGDTVTYRASVRGDAQQLAQAVAGVAKLRAEGEDLQAAGTVLRYRYLQ